MANELGTGGLLGALTGKNGANASSVSSHHTAMVTGASGRAKDAAAPMITIGNMTVNNDSSDGSVIKTIENNNQYKPADTSMLKMGGFFSTATGKLETSINKQIELIEQQSAAIVGKLEGIQAAVVEMNQTINKAMSAQISSFEEYSAFVKKQNAKTTLLHDAWMVISKGAREKEAAEKSYYNANQIAVWSKTDTFSLTKTIPNALAKINENIVTRFTDPKVRRILISETLKHYQRVHELMQDIIAGIENIRHNTHPIDQYVRHEFDVYNRAKHLGPYNPNNRRPNAPPPPPPQEAELRRTRNFDTLTMDDIEKALERKGTYTINGAQKNVTLWEAMKDRNHNLRYDKLDITNFLSGRSPDQKKLKKAFLSNIKKNKEKNSVTNISDKNLKALIAPTEKLTKATMLSASSSYALQGQMKSLGLAVDTSTSTVEKASSAMSAAMKLFTRFVNFKSIGSILFKLLKLYSVFRTGKSILGLVRGGIGLASSGSDKISYGFNWLKDRVPFVKSISDAIGGWWDKAKNYFLDKIGPTIETYVTTPIVEKTTSLFDRVFGAGAFKDALDNVSKYSRFIFTAAFGQDPAKREQAWSTLKNGIVSGYETVVKKYIIPAIAKVAFTAYSIKNFTKTVAKIPGAFSTLGKMWDAGYVPGDWANFRAGFKDAYNAAKRKDVLGAARGIKSGIGAKFNVGKMVEFIPGVNEIKEFLPKFRQAAKDILESYSIGIRGISNAIHGTGVQYDSNGNVLGNDTSSKFDLYTSARSAPKKAWNFAKRTYSGIKNKAITPRTVGQSLVTTFSNLKKSITGLPSKFKDMKTAFGGFGGMLTAGGSGLFKGIGKALSGGTGIFTSLLPLAKGLAKLATGVGIPIAIIAFLIKMILPAFRSAQSKGIGVGQYLKDTIVGWFESIKKTLYTEVGGFGGLAKMVMSGIAGVLEGVWIGIKSLFNADSAAGLIINIGKALLSGVVAVIPYLFKLIGIGLKAVAWDIPKAILWDIPKMLINSLFGNGSGDKIKVKAHAKGGIVDSPTYFKFGKGGTTQTGLMGEAGPEAILKLRRGKDGVLGVSIADSSNSLQQAIKSLDRTNAVTSTAMKRLTDAITRPNSFYDQKTVKQFTSTFKKLNISSDKMSQLSDIVKKNAGKEVTVDNIYELVDVLNGISSEQKDGNKSQKKANDDQTKRDTERNKTLTDSKKVSEAIKENLPEKSFWDGFVGGWEDSKRNLVRAWASLTGDYSYAKMTDSKSIDMFGTSVKDVERILGQLESVANNTANGFAWTQPGSDDAVKAREKANALNNLLKAYENDSLTESGINDINTLIKINGKKILGYNPLGSQSENADNAYNAYNADNLVKILAESKKFNKDTLDSVKPVLEEAGGILQGDTIKNFMAAINKTPDFSDDIRGKIRDVIVELNGKQVTEDTMNEIVKIVKGIEENQEEEANNNNEENVAENTFKKTLQNQIKSIKEYFIGGKFYADIDKAKMTVGGIMKTIGNSIYSLITGKQNAVIGNALKDTFGAGFGGLAAGLMGDSRAYEFISKINENAVKHGHSDIQRMMTSAKHTILSDVSDIAQFTKDTKITSEELASILKDAERYGWNINSESFKKLDAQIKGIPYVPEGKDGKTNSQAEGTSATQGSDGKVVSSNNAGQVSIAIAKSKAKQFEFNARHLDDSSKTSLLDSIKVASDKATSDQEKAKYSKLSEAVSTGKFESLSSSDWEILKNLSPRSKDSVSNMQKTISSVRFETYADKLLNTEGGYSPNDNGRGPVNHGILQSTLDAAIKKGIVKDTNIKDLTVEDAVKIYKAMYWDNPKIGNLPHPIDYLVFDTYVNGGALNVLRRTLKKLGVNGYGKAKFEDTLRATIDYCQSPEKTKKFGEAFLIARGERYLDLVRNKPAQKDYLNGWFNRLENISKQAGLESPFKDGRLVDEANKLLNEISSGKSTNNSGSIDVEELNEKLPEQATTAHNDLIKNIDQLRNTVSSKEKDLSDLSQTEIIGGEYSKGLNKAREDLKNIDSIYEKAKNGSGLTESDSKLLNDIAKAYGEKPLDFTSYKKVADEKPTDTSAVANTAANVDSDKSAKATNTTGIDTVAQAAKVASSGKPANTEKSTGVGTATVAVKTAKEVSSKESAEAAKQAVNAPKDTKTGNKNNNSKSGSKQVPSKGSKINSLRTELGELIKQHPELIEKIKNHVGDSLKPEIEKAIKQHPELVEGIKKLIKDSIRPEVEKLIKQHPELSEEDIKNRVKDLIKSKVDKFVKDRSKQAKKQPTNKAPTKQSTSYSSKEPYDNRLDLMEKIISSNLPEDEKDRRLQRIMDSYNENPKRRRKSSGATKNRQKRAATADSTNTKVKELVNQPPVQPSNRDDLIKNIDRLLNAVSSREHDLTSLSLLDINGEHANELTKAREDLENIRNIYEKTKNGSDPTKSDIELLNDAAKTYGGKPIDFNSYKKVVDEKTTDTSAVASASKASSSSKPAESAKPTGVGTATTAVDANSVAKSNKPQSTVASTTEWTEEEKKSLEKSIEQSNQLSKLRYDKFIEPKRHAADEATAKSDTKGTDSSIKSVVEKQAEQHSEQSTTNRINVDDLRKTIGELRADTLLKANELSVKLVSAPSDELREQYDRANEELKNLNNLYKKAGNGSNITESDIKYVDTLVEARKKEMLGNSPYKPEQDVKPITDSTKSEVSKQVEQGSKQATGQVNQPTAQPKVSKNDTIKAEVQPEVAKLVTVNQNTNMVTVKQPVKPATAAKPATSVSKYSDYSLEELLKNQPEYNSLAKILASNLPQDEKQRLADDLMEWNNAYSNRRRESAMANKQDDKPTADTNGAIKVGVPTKPVNPSKNTARHMEVTFQGRPELVNAINADFENSMNGRVSNTNIADSINANKMLDQLVEDSKKEAAARKAKTQATNSIDGSINAKQLNEQLPTQAASNHDDLIKFVDKLQRYMGSKISDLTEQFESDRSDENKKQLDKAWKESLNLDNILKNLKNGSDPTESDIELLNDVAKAYGEKPLDFTSYKKVADEKPTGEVTRTVENVGSEQPKAPTTTKEAVAKQSKNGATAKQPVNDAKRVKVDDGYLDFVQNLINETELDIQGKSWIGRIKSATSDEPSERSKIESLKKVLDEIKSGSISASTMDFLNENQDNFEAYRSWNSKATQFKMSDAAKSGLIELLKKKKDIAAKDKDGGLFTSNSTMVAAKRTYEALDKAIKEVQTDSLTNASMDLLVGDKDLYKYVKNLSFQPTTLDETFSKEIPDSEFDLSKTTAKDNLRYQQGVQQALEQVTDEDFKKDPYTALQNAVNALREATALQYVALTKMERPNVANVNNATVSTNSTSSILTNQSNTDDSYGRTNPLDAWMSGSNAILSSSQYWSL